MSLSESRKVAQDKFSEFCASRELKDFSEIVQIVHQDGSIFILHHACVWYSDEQFNAGMPLGDNYIPKWIGVSTEHNGDLLFFAGDLMDWWVRHA